MRTAISMICDGVAGVKMFGIEDEGEVSGQYPRLRYRREKVLVRSW